MGAEDIKLVADLENVVDNKEDEKEVPSLAKNIESQLTNAKQLVQWVRRDSLDFFSDTAKLYFDNILVFYLTQQVSTELSYTSPLPLGMPGVPQSL